MIQIKFAEDRTDEQIVTLLVALLRTKVGAVYDGVAAARVLKEYYGIYVDWHTTAAVLDLMSRRGLAECVQAWGMCRYLIQEKSDESNH